MKTKIQAWLVVGCILASLVWFDIGCGIERAPGFSSAPIVNAQTGQTNGYKFDISPGLSNVLVGAQAVNAQFVPPPYNALVSGGIGAVNLVLGGIAGLLGLFSAYQVKGKNQQQQAADLLAAALVKANPGVNPVQVAGGTSVLQHVAQHLDNNTL